MDVVHLTLTVEEADSLHSLLIVRRQAFIQHCQAHFHLTTPIRSYLAQLEALEAKLAQVTVGEYQQIEQALADEAVSQKHQQGGNQNDNDV